MAVSRRVQALPDVFIDFLKAVEDMKSTVMVPHVLVDLSVDTLSNDKQCREKGKEPPAVPSGEENGLYSRFQMLLRIKEELTSGHEIADVEADTLRSQVRAVVESLDYFRSLANEITQSYCQVCEERSLGTFRRVSSESSLSTSALERAGQLRAYRQRKFSSHQWTDEREVEPICFGASTAVEGLQTTEI